MTSLLDDMTPALWTRASPDENASYMQLTGPLGKNEDYYSAAEIRRAEEARAAKMDTFEHWNATKEAECNVASDSYFKARYLKLDTAQNRRIFENGFDRGFRAREKHHITERPPAAAYAVPEGWQLVPIDATPLMLEQTMLLDWADDNVIGNCHNMWKTMLAAAPQPPVAEPIVNDESSGK